jgi:ApaG protein
MSTTAERNFGSVLITAGYRVEVEPKFLPMESDTSANRYVFAYKIRITNQDGPVATLRRRAWKIVDAVGREERVEGDGVVGHQPLLAPGESFVYSSYCPLATAWGTMEGAFTMELEDESTFEIGVGRFFLVSPKG